MLSYSFNVVNMVAENSEKDNVQAYVQACVQVRMFKNYHLYVARILLWEISKHFMTFFKPVFMNIVLLSLCL